MKNRIRNRILTRWTLLPEMAVKKVIKLIELNNKYHLEDIGRYNEVLKKYEELNKNDPPRSDLVEKMQRIFLDMVSMIKESKETQIQFNNGIIKMLTRLKDNKRSTSCLN
jgi:hypothetical protein